MPPAHGAGHRIGRKLRTGGRRACRLVSTRGRVVGRAAAVGQRVGIVFVQLILGRTAPLAARQRLGQYRHARAAAAAIIVITVMAAILIEQRYQRLMRMLQQAACVMTK